MKYDHDIIVIGMGPAGMAVSGMGSGMGLDVCAIESHKIGGECMNVGCIPSKALLRMASARAGVDKLPQMELSELPEPHVQHPFEKIRSAIQYINENKTLTMFKKVHLVLGKGKAVFEGPHTVSVGGEKFSARKIFICTGTHPMIPPIPGLEDVEYLTNENIFSLDHIPESMTIIGGGAIGCEMAQAFSRLGCKTTIVQMDPYLLPFGDQDAGELLESQFRKEGIDVYNGRTLEKAENTPEGIALYTDKGEKLVSKMLLVAAGRKPSVDGLELQKAGVAFSPKGIKVNRHLRTSRKNIYAVGDCNGHVLLSHAAMHQGMIGLMNAMIPFPFKMDFRKYVVPWTVFTEPEVSRVGMGESELQAKGIPYERVEMKYEDYGAAIAENVAVGYVRGLMGRGGRILGASIVGRGSGEMIGEWALAIQKKIRIYDIMMLQHSFPTMSFLTKRVSEGWMMNKMASPFMQRLCKMMFRC